MMGFVIHAIRAVFTEQPVQTVHPLSGKPVMSRMPIAMTAPERRAVSRALQDVGVSFGETGRVEFADGGQLELDVSDVGFSVTTRRPFSPMSIELLFQLARQGNFFFQASMEEGLFLFSQEQLHTIPPEILTDLEDTPQLCQTADELAQRLGVGHEQWEAHRRQVVAGS